LYAAPRLSAQPSDPPRTRFAQEIPPKALVQGRFFEKNIYFVSAQIRSGQKQVLRSITPKSHVQPTFSSTDCCGKPVENM